MGLDVQNEFVLNVSDVLIKVGNKYDSFTYIKILLRWSSQRGKNLSLY